MTSCFHINSVNQLHELASIEPPKHPLFSIHRLEHLNLKPSGFPERMTYDFYSVGLKKNLSGYVKYGRTNYDFQEGALGFTAPQQLMEFNQDIIDNAQGWILFFHKELLNGSDLLRRLDTYGFFGYQTNEGLHLSRQEEASVELIFENIETEYQRPIDTYSKPVVISNLELLFTYSQRYYARQFVVRNEVDPSVLVSFKKELSVIFNDPGNFRTPSVEQLADKLHFSGNYLSDLLKATTGKSALEHIHQFIVERAQQTLLNSDKPISEIAHELGFEYPHYFSRLFKKKTGLTPSEYRVRPN